MKDTTISNSTAITIKGTSTTFDRYREIETSEQDLLGWNEYAQRMAKLLQSDANESLTMCVQGDWGSGKTSFINLIEEGLGDKEPINRHKESSSKDDTAPRPIYRRRWAINRYNESSSKDQKQGQNEEDLASEMTERVRSDNTGKEYRSYIIHFNCWLHSQSSYGVDELFPIYVSQVIEDYLHATQPPLRNITAHLAETYEEVNRRSNRTIAWGQFARSITINASGKLAQKLGGDDKDSEDARAYMARLLGEVPPSKLVTELSKLKQDFQHQVNQLLGNKESGSIKRLIIIVDDLDRVEPSKAIDILEKLKIFLDAQRVIFILAADLRAIEDGLRARFGENANASYGKDYLDKIVKVRFNIPPIQPPALVRLGLEYEGFKQAFNLYGPQDEVVYTAEVALGPLLFFPEIYSNLRAINKVLTNFEFAWSLSPFSEWEPKARRRLARLVLAITTLYQYNHKLAREFFDWLAENHEKHVSMFSRNSEDNVEPVQVSESETGEEDHNKEVEQFFKKLSERSSPDNERILAFFHTIERWEFSIRDLLSAYAASAWTTVSDYSDALYRQIREANEELAF